MRYFPRRSFFKSLFVVPTAAAAIEAMPSQAMAKQLDTGYTVIFKATAYGIPEAGMEVCIYTFGFMQRALITSVVVREDYTAMVTVSLLDLYSAAGYRNI